MGIAATKRQKEQAKYKLPPCSFTEAEQEAYMYCVDNEIRISPIGIQGTPGKWHIGISTPDNHKKVYNSPEICDKHTVWEIFNKYTKYYYDQQ